MDMKKKLLFVFNPRSGKAQIKNQLLDIVDTMVKADYEVTIYPTQCAGDAKEKVEAYAGNYDLVVCSGGDGTLDEVVTGDAPQNKSPIGIHTGRKHERFCFFAWNTEGHGKSGRGGRHRKTVSVRCRSV